ncbi:MAG: UDP-N-acetylmuramate--L-alanine ligase [Candidatus Latescibacteria bacterium]|nr:UDP-N-acetylmuramate--L-alanine ligase [Candidatus Latescibacterota bacterium]
MGLFDGVRSVYFVGIGGIGMSAIAEILHEKGFRVTGSDMKRSEVTDRLARNGMKVFEGHDRGYLDNPDLVIVSSAIPPSNPEVIAAQQRGIRVVSRAEVLGAMMAEKRGIGVAGTHGKTTTTSMIGTILITAGCDPTFLIGGDLVETGTNAQLGRGELFLAEADEFDRSFWHLTPEVGVITSIDTDHLDCYRDMDEVKEAFIRFANGVKEEGTVIVCSDDEQVVETLPHIQRRVVTYGLRPGAWVRAGEVELTRSGASFMVVVGGEVVGSIWLSQPGLHNVTNALAAIGVCLRVGIDFEEIRRGLEAFKGVRRRFETKGEAGGVLVVDDYAHHPTEIIATLRGAKIFGRRLIVLFQPHLYSRTLHLALEFGRALLEADEAVVTDVYPAREAPIEGVSGRLIVEAAEWAGHHNTLYVAGLTEAVGIVVKKARPGDMIVTMGAGDVGEVGEEILKKLKMKNAE